jgi:hypothetical protein
MMKARADGVEDKPAMGQGRQHLILDCHDLLDAENPLGGSRLIGDTRHQEAGSGEASEMTAGVGNKVNFIRPER